MKKSTFILGSISLMIAVLAGLNSCSTSELISTKSGAQIWGENCIRCHNPPSPDTFSDAEWEVAGTHMQIRANLTQDETAKVVAFLQSAN